MRTILRAAMAGAFFTLLQFVLQSAAQGAPGDFLLETGAKVHLSSPHAIARDQKGNVYVTSLTYYTGKEMGRGVQVYDKTGKRLYKWGTYGSGDGELAYPSGIAVASGGKVFVTETLNHRVQMFDSTGKFLDIWGSFGVGDGEFNAPSAIAVDAADNLYVCDSGNHRIQVFDSTGRFLKKWGSAGSDDGQFSNPAAVAVDAAGNVYVADSGNFRIQVFDSSGNFLRKWGSKGQGNGKFFSPSALAFDNSGHLLVTDSVKNQVQVFDNAGTFITKWGGATEKGGFLSGPSGVVVQPDGATFVVGTAEEGISVFDSAGDLLFSWGSGGAPLGLAVDPDDNVYVADSGQNPRIQVFTGTGTLLREWGGPPPYGLWQPFDVALSSAVDVYVTDPYTGSIRAFTKFGVPLRSWGAGSSSPIAEAVSLAIDPSDRLYAAYGLGIQAFDLFGNLLLPVYSWEDPKVSWVIHIATDSNGRVYVSDTGYKRVNVFDSQGNLLRTIGEGYFASGGPGAIDVDINGNVFVAGTSDPTVSNSNEILVFDASGKLRATWGGFGDDAGLFNMIGGIATNKTGTRVYVTDSGRIQVLEGFGGELPPGWLTRNIGSVGVTGGAGYNNGTFTIAGSGADIWGTADAFRYVYQQLTGDGQVVARVATLPNTQGFAKAGVMIREALTANSPHAMVDITPGYGAEFSRRSTTGGSTTVTSLGGVSAPYWVKLVRSGSTFSGYVSKDGATWTLLGTSTITMGSSVYIGLVDSSHVNTTLNVATIDGVSVTGLASVPTVAITSPTAGSTFSAPASIPIAATATPGSGAAVARVDFYSGATLIGSDTTTPYGITWSSVPAGDYTLTALVVDTLGKSATSAPVAVSVVSSGLPQPWLTGDVGSVGLTGSAGFANGVFTIKGAGADIWGTADGFRFVYQPFTGDGEIVARVASLTTTNGYAKAGVMFRQSLAANSMHTMMVLTPSYGAEFSVRSSTGGSTAVTGLGGVAAPYWVKLVRSGNTFTGYIASGGTWRQVGSTTIAMGSTVYIGLAVCSHNTAALTTATIDNVRVTPGQNVLPTVTITAPTSGATYAAPATINLSATATPGTGATVKQVDYYAGSTLIGTATTVPYTAVWSNVAAGSYTLTAVVIDTLGDKGTSAPVAITVSALPSPWLTLDIGSVGVAGSAGYAGGVFTLKGSGADIWGSSDAFRFVYKPMAGDGQITARVSALQNTNSYAKAGVMIRETLVAGSKHALIDLTPTSGAEFLRRADTGGSTVATKRYGVAAPYWVRLVRSGSTFSGYVSSNGTTWTLVGSSTIAMNSTVYVGLIVSSHNNSVLCTTTIDNVQ